MYPDYKKVVRTLNVRTTKKKFNTTSTEACAITNLFLLTDESSWYQRSELYDETNHEVDHEADHDN